MRALPLLFVVAACSPAQSTATQAPIPTTSAPGAADASAPADDRPSLVSTACAEDSDCAVTNFSGCCQACPGPISAVSRTELERQKKQCAVVECTQKQEHVRCEPTESLDHYLAMCRNRACEVVPAPKANSPSPSASAWPVDNTTPPQAPPLLTSSERCAKDDECVVSNFGGCCTSCDASAFATSKKALEARNRVCAAVDCALSTRPCAPAVPAAQYRAACRAGACVGVKR